MSWDFGMGLDMRTGFKMGLGMGGGRVWEGISEWVKYWGLGMGRRFGMGLNMGRVSEWELGMGRRFQNRVWYREGFQNGDWV